MGVGAVKKSELVLSDEVRELYDKCQKTAKESLERLNKEGAGIDTAFLEKFKNPEKLLKMKPDELDSVLNTAYNAVGKLNSIFAKRNNLPEFIGDDEKSKKFLSDYIEKNFGRKMDIIIREQSPTPIATDGVKNLTITKDYPLLLCIGDIPHEMKHTDQPFVQKVSDLSSLVTPVYNKRGNQAFVNFYSSLTGINTDDIKAEIYIQSNYGRSKDPLFLLHLYEIGLWKPTDGKIKENAEFSKFMLDKDLRRACDRYVEGRADMVEVRMLDSSDDVIKADAAILFLGHIPMKTPQVYHEEGDFSGVEIARNAEGFRFYYTLAKRIGEERLKEFEAICTRKEVVPGVDIDGNLVVIFPKEMGMHKVDTDKLKAGITDINELTGKTAKTS